MKKLLTILFILSISFLSFGQKQIKKEADPETGLWKISRLYDTAHSDTLDLIKTTGDSTILSGVFKTSAIMSCALEIYGRNDSLDIEKVRVYQWYQYRSAALDDSNFTYISDLEWTGRTPGTASASISAHGTYSCNITNPEHPITCERYARLEFVLRGDHKKTSGITAIVNLITWWDKP